jgi:arsenate reductase (thioredoxin)
MSRVFSLAACIFALGTLASDALGGRENSRKVTFVCEHGVAKSVIAAALFNREAEARGLNAFAEARGIEPEATIQPATAAGLTGDGMDISRYSPSRLNARDVEESSLVVTIGVLEEPDFLVAATFQEWDEIPPVSTGYDSARDALEAKVHELIMELERSSSK